MSCLMKMCPEKENGVNVILMKNNNLLSSSQQGLCLVICGGYMINLLLEAWNLSCLRWHANIMI